MVDPLNQWNILCAKTKDAPKAVLVQKPYPLDVSTIIWCGRLGSHSPFYGGGVDEVTYDILLELSPNMFRVLNMRSLGL